MGTFCSAQGEPHTWGRRHAVTNAVTGAVNDWNTCDTCGWSRRAAALLCEARCESGTGSGTCPTCGSNYS
jgi:hypothetical protein